MIKVSNIKVPLEHNMNDVLNRVKKKLRVKNIINYSICKKSLDARKKDNIQYVYTLFVSVENEKNYLHINDVSIAKRSVLNIAEVKLDSRPVVVGSGPAGLFCALVLTLAKTNPIIIERGSEVDTRVSEIDSFWNDGILNPNSNVQFGEGGAGTFSDGKLTTGIKDNKIEIVLDYLIKFGAPKEIAYLSKPHIGTDILRDVVKNMREFLIKNGAEYIFNTSVVDINTSDNKISSVVLSSGSVIETSNAVFAIGHSARDTFEMLYKNNVEMKAKPFAVGVRIEHLQSEINKVQYGDNVINAAEYKLACNIDGSGVYTFCMCPGGEVVAAASELNTVVTNGMSYYARDNINANSALIVTIDESVYGSNSPLDGMMFQRELEKAAYIAGGSNYYAPVQKVEDFINNIKTTSLGAVKPTYKPGYKLVNLNDYLQDDICDALKQGIIKLDKKLNGFASSDAILTGFETRTSSPVRFMRNVDYTSNIGGLYPCGEGAGYAGGIMSAAVDGMKCAEAILKTTIVEEIEYEV